MGPWGPQINGAASIKRLRTGRAVSGGSNCAGVARDRTELLNHVSKRTKRMNGGHLVPRAPNTGLALCKNALLFPSIIPSFLCNYCQHLLQYFIGANRRITGTVTNRKILGVPLFLGCVGSLVTPCVGADALGACVLSCRANRTPHG